MGGNPWKECPYVERAVHAACVVQRIELAMHRNLQKECRKELEEVLGSYKNYTVCRDARLCVPYLSKNEFTHKLGYTIFLFA